MTTKTNIQAGYKDSSVGVIPQEWEVRRLSDLGEVYSGGTPDTENEEYWDGDILWCTPSDITSLQTIYIYNTNKRITTKGLKHSSAILLPTNTIIVCTRATIGNAVIAGTPLSTNQGFKNIIPKCCDAEWLLYSLISNKKQLEKLACGSTFLEVSKKDFENFKLPIPPIEEQRKIAEILSVWDEVIEKQCRLIERLEERKRALMQRLLTGRMRIHGFNTPWQKVKLGEICKKVTRRNEENCQNVMTISAKRGFVCQTDFFNKSVASSILDNYYLVLKDEFCYNKSYSNGYPMGAIKRLKETEKAVVTTLYICFSVANSKRLNINFFEQYCEYGGLNRGLTKVANEGGRAHGLLNVTPSDFFGLKLLLPSLEEQKAIAEMLATADNEIVAHRKKLDSLRMQKRGLMQQLLTGKIRVKNRNYGDKFDKI